MGNKKQPNTYIIRVMNRYQYISLDQKRQIRLLNVKGKILHRKMKMNYSVSLYQLENFYIEIWVSSLKGQVINLVTFKDLTLLNFPFKLKNN